MVKDGNLSAEKNARPKSTPTTRRGCVKIQFRAGGRDHRLYRKTAIKSIVS